jgi:hypothetical protein
MPPYGHFKRLLASKREVWIGGGIGISPFIAWLTDQSAKGFDKVTLFYFFTPGREFPSVAVLGNLPGSTARNSSVALLGGRKGGQSTFPALGVEAEATRLLTWGMTATVITIGVLRLTLRAEDGHRQLNIPILAGQKPAYFAVKFRLWKGDENRVDERKTNAPLAVARRTSANMIELLARHFAWKSAVSRLVAAER